MFRNRGSADIFNVYPAHADSQYILGFEPSQPPATGVCYPYIMPLLAEDQTLSRASSPMSSLSDICYRDLPGLRLPYTIRFSAALAFELKSYDSLNLSL